MIRARDDSALAEPVDITVLAGSPTAPELAAVTAVLASMAEESADGTRLEVDPSRSAWQISQVALREPLRPGRGAWRSFSG